MNRRKTENWRPKVRSGRDWRLEAFRFGTLAFAAVIVFRLFLLQVVEHGFYKALASGQHEIYEVLTPERGEILVHDLKDRVLVPFATNQRLGFVYAEPKRIDDPRGTAVTLGNLLGYDEEQTEALERRLDKPDDPYEPVQRFVPEAVLVELDRLRLKGIAYVREEARVYPEGGLGGHVIGFYGMDKDGNYSGKYGAEGYFDTLLAGTPGYIRSERDIAGRLIAIGERSIERAVDGSDVVLTIDRTIQFATCKALREAVATHRADGGSVIVLDPSTGRVLAMCGEPDFDPNRYAEVGGISDFNNPAIFSAYEPGSIFKPIGMAAGIDSGAVTPHAVFTDSGSVKIEEFTIKNALEKRYGTVTMTEVLENSINTGMIHVMRETGRQDFVDYIKAFGFGRKAGIRLATESSGDITSLDIPHDLYAATASYGQGITVTPLQMAAAYAAIANGGILMRPYAVDEVRHVDGSVDKAAPEEIRRVIESRTARLIGAMLISVVDNGHAGQAAVPGYYIAGKTGTAQVAGGAGGGYRKDVTIASFVGFGPVEDPRFVIITRIDHPRTTPWADATAAPLFGEIAKFLLQYFEVAPTRAVE